MLPSPTPSPYFHPSRSPPVPPDSQQSHWDPWVIALVGACCTIFLLFSYYRLLRRHCCVSNPRNGDQMRHLNDNHHHPNDPSPQFQNQGLDSYITRSLPIVQFKKKNDAERSGTTQKNTDCAVCLGEFEEGEWLKHLPNCGHVFHVSCIDTWFQTRSSCPLCRSHVFNLEYSFSMLDMRETLSREDLRRERSAIYQALWSQIRYSAYRVEPENTS